MGEVIVPLNPQIGDEVLLTESCESMGLKIGDIVTVEEFKDGMIKFHIPNLSMGCWTNKFGPKIRQCTCTMNDLLTSGCTCGGQ